MRLFLRPENDQKSCAIWLYSFLDIALLLGFSPANADWHGELSFRSDYVYRGYSKSQGNPVVQGLIDYQGDAGWFGGLGLSQVSYDSPPNPDRAEIEIKPYVGWA